MNEKIKTRNIETSNPRDCRINAKAVAISLGLMWSLGLMFISIISLLTNGYLLNISQFIETIYIGYSLSFLGILTGMVWAFLDASIAGLVFSWLYNKISARK